MGGSKKKSKGKEHSTRWYALPKKKGRAWI